MKDKIIFFIFLLFPTFCYGSEVGVVVNAQIQIVPSTTVVVADPAQIIITFSSQKDVFISTVPIPEIENLHITKTEMKTVQSPSPDVFVKQWVIEFFPLSLGLFSWPSLTFSSQFQDQNLTIISPMLQFNVVQPENAHLESESIKDIKGPEEVGVSFVVWLLILLTIFLLGGVGFYYKNKNKKRVGSTIQEIVRPPDEVALEKLGLLRADFNKNGDVKIFYSGMADILREYLSRQFKMDAFEKTTQEIFYEMRRKLIDRKVCLQCKSILSNCDLVKFAKGLPSVPEAEKDCENICQLIADQTKEKVLDVVQENQVTVNAPWTPEEKK